jgi:hypothetical protein
VSVLSDHASWSIAFGMSSVENQLYASFNLSIVSSSRALRRQLFVAVSIIGPAIWLDVIGGNRPA